MAAAQPFMAAAKKYFGTLPGQTLLQFKDEIKELSYEDRLEIAEGMRKAGVDCADPHPPKE